MCIALKKFDFGETFIKGIQILLRNQDSCELGTWILVTATKYFKLDKKLQDKETLFLLIYLFMFLK